MTKWNKYLLTLFFLSFLLPVTAQEKVNVTSHLAAEKGWYMGVQGGVPFGISTFNAEAPAMENGGTYTPEVVFDIFRPGITVTITEINGWIKGETTEGEILNPNKE